MDRSEYTKFLDDFSKRFPDDAAWLGKRPDTMRLWFDEVFCAMRLEDCREVSRGLMSGEIEGWSAYERQRIVVVFRREVGKIRAARRTASTARRVGEYESLMKTHDAHASGYPMLKAVAKLREMREAGVSESERREWLDSVYP